jgi:hypothetical protein
LLWEMIGNRSMSLLVCLKLLDKCYITTYVKNEKFNFNIMTSALKLIVCHEFLG